MLWRLGVFLDVSEERRFSAQQLHSSHRPDGKALQAAGQGNHACAQDGAYDGENVGGDFGHQFFNANFELVPTGVDGAQYPCEVLQNLQVSRVEIGPQACCCDVRHFDGCENAVAIAVFCHEVGESFGVFYHAWRFRGMQCVPFAQALYQQVGGANEVVDSAHFLRQNSVLLLMRNL